MEGSADLVCPRRKILKTVVSTLCCEAGFTSAEGSTLETLTEMIQSYLYEVGRSSQAFCELACRTEPMLSDVVMALVEMGMDVKSLPAYAKRPNKSIVANPIQSAPQPNPKSLTVGQKKNHPSHIPDYLPPFPDPHTYIKTDTHKEPEVEYESVREKAATQKRDVERALTRFIAKTGETESLFADDPYAFPLIANKAKPLPYLDCLMPKEEDLAMLDKHSGAQISASGLSSTTNTTTPTPTVLPPTDSQSSTNNSSSTTVVPGAKSAVVPPTADSQPQPPGGNSGNNNAPAEGATDTDSQIDNPYLREIKMPRLKGAGKKSTSIQAMSSSTKWSF